MENQETIDEERGEVGIVLDGRTYPMLASFEAVTGIEKEIGAVLGLGVRLADANNMLSTHEIAVIITHCMRAAGNAREDDMLKATTKDRVRELLFEAGVKNAIGPLTTLFLRMLNGTGAKSTA